jgi:hypothetical protein
LRREFAEEVAMEFDSLQLMIILLQQSMFLFWPRIKLTFFHIGMIYHLNGCRCTEKHVKQQLEHVLIDPKALSEDHCSNLLWKYTQTQIVNKRIV